MFLARFIVVWSLLHLYVGWRAAGVPALTRRVPRRWLLGAAALLWITFPLARMLERRGPRALYVPLEIVGSTWLGVLFLTVVCLLVVELATGFGFLLRRRAPALRGLALAGGGLLSALALLLAALPPAVRDHEVRVPGLPADADGLVVVVLSDAHLGNLRGAGWLRARVAQINALRPDLILAVGDLLDGRGEAARDPGYARALARLSAPLGVWAVLGNHELKTPEASVRLLEAAGMRLLRDGWHELRPGLVLAGAEDPGNGRWTAIHVAPHLARALAGRPPGAATLLASHRPQAAEVAARAGASLMLSGHTHGGQLWPFTLIAQAAHPLLEGRHDVEGMPVIVSRGAGTWGPRMRLWRRGEIVRITLRAAPAR